jgi:hypothetical protein
MELAGRVALVLRLLGLLGAVEQDTTTLLVLVLAGVLLLVEVALELLTEVLTRA